MPSCLAGQPRLLMLMTMLRCMAGHTEGDIDEMFEYLRRLQWIEGIHASEHMAHAIRALSLSCSTASTDPDSTMLFTTRSSQGASPQQQQPGEGPQPSWYKSQRGRELWEKNCIGRENCCRIIKLGLKPQSEAPLKETTALETSNGAHGLGSNANESLNIHINKTIE